MNAASLCRLCVALLATGWSAASAVRASAVHTAVLELAPAALAIEHRSAAAQDIFYLRRCIVDVGGGPVNLTSTRGGAMRTDDAVRIDVERPDGTHATWEHDFRDGATGGIAEIPPQRIDELFAVGVHTVTIALLDLRPPVRSSTGYLLRYVARRESSAACIEGAAIALHDSAVVRSEAAAPDDALRWDGPPAAAAPRTAAPSQVVRPTAEVRAEHARRETAAIIANDVAMRVHETTNAATFTDAGVGLDRDESTKGSATLLPSMKTWTSFPYLLAAAIIGLLVLVAYAMQRAAPCMSGLLSVQDMQTGERLDHIELVQYGQQAWIQRAPLRLHAGAAAQDAAGGLAADGDGGCVFRSEVGGRRVLRDGDIVMIGEHVRLQYRAPATVYARSTEAVS